MRAPEAWLGISLCLALGCRSGGPPPSLLTLTGVSPQQLDLGDQLEIAGSGFPEGKPARILFEGTLYRPGMAPVRSARIATATVTQSPRALTVLLDQQLQESFCGKGTAATHTTFRGSVRVEFEPRDPGAPLVTGGLPEVELDLESPLPSPALQRHREAQTAAALSFLGVELANVARGECCVVRAANGRFAASGIQSGDLLRQYNGLNIRSPEDLTPSGRDRTARLVVHRPGLDVPLVREIDVQGFQSAAPSVLAPAIAIVTAVLACLSFLTAPVRRAASWFERTLQGRLPSLGGSTVRLGRPQDYLARALAYLSDETMPHDAALRVLSLLGFGVITALNVLLGLHVEIVSRELDLAVGWIAATSLIVLAALWHGWLAQPPSALKGLRQAGRAALLQLPSLALLVAAVLRAHSVGIDDLVRSQTAAPNGWHVFDNPGLMALTGLALLALVPQIEPTHRGPSFALGRGGSCGSQGTSTLQQGLAWLGSTAHLWYQAVILAILAFGGWNVPGWEDGEPADHLSLQILGVLLLQAKAWALVGVVLVMRWLVGGLALSQATHVSLRIGIPCALVGVLVSEFWNRGVEGWALDWIDDVTEWTLLGWFTCAIAWVMARVIAHMRAPRVELGPSPWI